MEKNIEPPLVLNGLIDGVIPALRIVFLGSNLVSGVGLSSPQQSVGFVLGDRIASLKNRAVLWEMYGRVGLKLSDICSVLLEDVPVGRPDLCVIVPSETDVLSPGHLDIQTEIPQLNQQVRQRFGDVPIVYTCFPENIIGAKWPLVSVLHKKARVYNHVLSKVVDNESLTQLVSFQSCGFFSGDQNITERHRLLAEELFDLLTQ